MRAYFYDGVPENISAKKKGFLKALEHKGIQTRTRILKKKDHTCVKCNHKFTKDIQKGVDVCLATDILRHALQRSCEICIVVSGDSDYIDAMELAKNNGIKVWVASFRRSLSKDIRADKIILLDDIFEDIKQR